MKRGRDGGMKDTSSLAVAYSSWRSSRMASAVGGAA